MSLDKRKVQRDIVDQLRDVPFINHAIRKVGIARMTFYRWMKTDKVFEFNVSAALQEGHKNMIEIAESALAKKIREGHFGSIKFYLENNHGNYMNRKYRIETLPERNYDDSPVYAEARIPKYTTFDEEQMEQIDEIQNALEGKISQEEMNQIIDMARDGTLSEIAEELKKERWLRNL